MKEKKAFCKEGTQIGQIMMIFYEVKKTFGTQIWQIMMIFYERKERILERRNAD